MTHSSIAFGLRAFRRIQGFMCPVAARFYFLFPGFLPETGRARVCLTPVRPTALVAELWPGIFSRDRRLLFHEA